MPDAPAIFISYRRRDAAGHARALHRDPLPPISIGVDFFDLQSIESGDVFPKTLSEAVAGCRVMLALIGPDWLEAAHADGLRWLDDPRDFVRQEIAQALSLDKKVIPVLFDDTLVPNADKLPAPLKKLADCDVLILRGKAYEYDTQLAELVRLLAKVPGVPQPFPDPASAERYYRNLPALEPVDRTFLEKARQKLAQMPLETIPDRYALPAGSCHAFAHNPLFVGRESDLKTLARLLKGGKNAGIDQVAAATGMGGIGKTQLASEFVHRYGQYFAGGVYWLNFSDAQAVPAELANCSRPDQRHFDLETQIRLVLSAWQDELPRLLVFDNCEDEVLFDQWRPKSGASRVLITSWRPDWDASLGLTAVPLGVLEHGISIELLQKLASQLDREQAADIADELGDLPLALHLAGSFLRRYAGEVSPETYLRQLKDRSPVLRWTPSFGRFFDGAKLYAG